MRGKAYTCSVRKYVERITPAYAGKSSILYDAIDTMRDHPRLCGEKTSGACQTYIDLGSPPPMRGKDNQKS